MKPLHTEIILNWPKNAYKQQQQQQQSEARLTSRGGPSSVVGPRRYEWNEMEFAVSAVSPVAAALCLFSPLFTLSLPPPPLSLSLSLFVRAITLTDAISSTLLYGSMGGVQWQRMAHTVQCGPQGLLLLLKKPQSFNDVRMCGFFNFGNTLSSCIEAKDTFSYSLSHFLSLYLPPPHGLRQQWPASLYRMLVPCANGYFLNERVNGQLEQVLNIMLTHTHLHYHTHPLLVQCVAAAVAALLVPLKSIGSTAVETFSLFPCEEMCLVAALSGQQRWRWRRRMCSLTLAVVCCY